MESFGKEISNQEASTSTMDAKKAEATPPFPSRLQPNLPQPLSRFKPLLLPFLSFFKLSEASTPLFLAFLQGYPLTPSPMLLHCGIGGITAGISARWC